MKNKILSAFLLLGLCQSIYGMDQTLEKPEDKNGEKRKGETLESENQKRNFFAAAEVGDKKLLSTLLSNGASPAWLKYGLTVLHVAAMKGHLDLVRWLVLNNPNLLNKVDAFNDWTALNFAARGRHLLTISFLAGMYSVNMQFNALLTAIRGGQLEVVQLLLQNYPSLAAQTGLHGKTALDLAVSIMDVKKKG